MRPLAGWFGLAALAIGTFALAAHPEVCTMLPGVNVVWKMLKETLTPDYNDDISDPDSWNLRLEEASL
eukprot:268896-Pelagomonas_calceolata.AAC.1